MRNDQHRSSLCVSLAEDQVAEGLSDVEKAWVAGSLSYAFSQCSLIFQTDFPKVLLLSKLFVSPLALPSNFFQSIMSLLCFQQTSTTLMLFLYAMVLHPNVQQHAQRELDRVIGRSRSPTFADMPELPYLRAIVKEVRLSFPLLTPLSISPLHSTGFKVAARNTFGCATHCDRGLFPIFCLPGMGYTYCASIQDDWYEGYFIPKGTACIPNVW